jgi:capsular polysaccharide biosynthesis protein
VELKYYVSILKRRWIPVVMVPLLVGILVIVQVLVSQPAFSTSAQFTVTRVPQQIDIEEFRYNEYYLFLSSEFLVDDLVEVVVGNIFADDVHQRILAEYGEDIPGGEVQAAISSERTHRILTLDVSHNDEDAAVMIAQSATRQLNEDATKYFGFDDDERGALVETIQFPGGASPDTGRDQIFWALQLLLAVFGGLLVGIFLEYIDDRLYTSEMVEDSLDLDVIGEVPRGRVSS